MNERKQVNIDPKPLREECLSFGLFLNVASSIARKQNGELSEKDREGLLLMAAYFLYGEALSSPSKVIVYTALAYERRELQKEDGSIFSFPAWGEGKESEAERYSDAFFSLYALYLGEKEGSPEDYLGPIMFFSGAIREDIEEALQKKEGDPHYDAFYSEISSYPFSLDILGAARKLYDIAHV
ncbi:MAG: hypothetical protein K6B65_04530 [Bacilli bacterium]|nr:hypothetical protein [Bacilli bacterium]